MLPVNKYEEKTLLSLLSQDSEYAFQMIFDQHKNNIYKVCMLYVKSPIIAEELVQDVFMKLWFHRHHLAQINSLESWLFIVTKNLTLNCLKKIAYEWTARANLTKQTEDSQHSADGKIITEEYQKLLQTAVNNLPPQQQHAYRLAKEQGLSYERIGSQLSVSPLTVKTHMARAMASIRSFLTKNGMAPFLITLAMFVTN